MFGRSWIVVFLLGAALLPYCLSSKSSFLETAAAPLHWFNQAKVDKPSKGAKGETKPASAAPADKPTEAEPADKSDKSSAAALQPATPAPRNTSEVKLVPFEQAWQWNLTPAWVMSTWPRVTTELADLDLQGYRTSYVSGTGEGDVAGSLSYYFDGRQRLQRIEFRGTTGDARRLVQFLAAHHRFERHLSSDPSTYLYQVEQSGRALSEMRITAAPVISSGNALRRFEVSLSINRPQE